MNVQLEHNRSRICERNAWLRYGWFELGHPEVLHQLRFMVLFIMLDKLLRLRVIKSFLHTVLRCRFIKLQLFIWLLFALFNLIWFIYKIYNCIYGNGDFCFVGQVWWFEITLGLGISCLCLWCLNTASNAHLEYTILYLPPSTTFKYWSQWCWWFFSYIHLKRLYSKMLVTVL